MADIIIRVEEETDPNRVSAMVISALREAAIKRMHKDSSELSVDEKLCKLLEWGRKNDADIEELQKQVAILKRKSKLDELDARFRPPLDVWRKQVKEWLEHWESNPDSRNPPPTITIVTDTTATVIHPKVQT